MMHITDAGVWERAEGPGTGPAGGASDPSGGSGKRKLGVVRREDRVCTRSRKRKEKRRIKKNVNTPCQTDRDAPRRIER
jgi:hypothetical protein